jgi:hypothetical protein
MKEEWREAQTLTLERTLSDLVNQAFVLTPLRTPCASSR